MEEKEDEEDDEGLETVEATDEEKLGENTEDDGQLQVDPPNLALDPKVLDEAKLVGREKDPGFEKKEGFENEELELLTKLWDGREQTLNVAKSKDN